jgi:hypothetical protein
MFHVYALIGKLGHQQRIKNSTLPFGLLKSTLPDRLLSTHSRVEVLGGAHNCYALSNCEE